MADDGGRKREQMQTTARCAGAAFAALRSNAAECSFGVLPASGAARDSFFRGQLDPKQHPGPAFGRSDTLCGVLSKKVVKPQRQPQDAQEHQWGAEVDLGRLRAAGQRYQTAEPAGSPREWTAGLRRHLGPLGRTETIIRVARLGRPGGELLEQKPSGREPRVKYLWDFR